MASGIYTEVKKRIELAEPGTVFLTSDFTDIATTTTVRKCLGSVKQKGRQREDMGLFAEGFKEFIRKLNILAYMGYNFQ